MQADRHYTTDEGHAHAAYDGSAWYVTAHPANGSGQRDALSVTTYRDEAGFRGRQWLVEGPASDAIPDGDNDMGAGYATLRSVAETAIAAAAQRVRVDAIRAEARAEAEASTPESESLGPVVNPDGSPSDVTVAMLTGVEHAPGTCSPMCLACEARLEEQAATGLQAAASLSAAATRDARQTAEADGTALTPAEARELVRHWADRTLATGLVVMQFGYGDVDDWVGLQDPSDVDDEQPLCLAAEGPGAPDPAGFLAGVRRLAAANGQIPTPTHMLTYPAGDVDRVSIVSVRGDLTDDTTAVVRLPDHTIRTVLTLDLVGLDGAPDPHTDDDVECRRCLHTPHGEDVCDAPLWDSLGTPVDPCDCRGWPSDYAALGIQPDTWACVVQGSRAEAEPLVFTLLAEGREVRLARDPEDPERWHLAVRGGMAGPDGPAVFLSNLRPEELVDPMVCQHPMTRDSAQHPLAAERVESPEA